VISKESGQKKKKTTEKKGTKTGDPNFVIAQRGVREEERNVTLGHSNSSFGEKKKKSHAESAIAESERHQKKKRVKKRGFGGMRARKTADAKKK